MHHFDLSDSVIQPWRILFLATGLLTIVSGIVFTWNMPDSQLNARFLSKRDRVLAVIRIRGNGQGIGNKTFKAYQLKEAMTDPLTWMFVFYSLVHSIPNGKHSSISQAHVIEPRSCLDLDPFYFVAVL
jgi:ACS family allantoate permease-like MFS transporter